MISIKQAKGNNILEGVFSCDEPVVLGSNGKGRLIGDPSDPPFPFDPKISNRRMPQAFGEFSGPYSNRSA